MKELLRQITSIAMALIVLLSTMSFTVGMHYCGEHLVDFSVFTPAESCGMEAMMSTTTKDDCSVMKMDCCTDVEIVMEGQDDLKISFDQITFEQQTFITTFVYSYIDLFEEVDENNIPFKEYAPPPLIRDVQVLDQTFLI